MAAHITMKILIVLTSHSELGDTGKKTGFWVEEFTAKALLKLLKNLGTKERIQAYQ